MHIARASWPSANGKVYESIYLRESYREGGRVRKRNIANLTHCDPQEIAAIELALQSKGNLAALGSLDKIQLTQGLSVGAVWSVYETAGRLGIPKVLGDDFNGQLALWQVLARGDGPMHENTHLDLAYVRRVRFTTDCKILLHTIPVLLGRRTGF